MEFNEATSQAKHMLQVFRGFSKLEEVLTCAGRAEGVVAGLVTQRDELADEVKVLTARAAKLRGEKKELRTANLAERVKTSEEVKALVDAGALQLKEQREEASRFERAMNEDFQSKRVKLEGELNRLKHAVGEEEKRLHVATEAARVARAQIEGLG